MPSPTRSSELRAWWLTSRRKPGGLSFRGVTQHAVDLAHTLHLTVITEGVETAGQVEQLLAVGCNIGDLLAAQPQMRIAD